MQLFPIKVGDWIDPKIQVNSIQWQLFWYSSNGPKGYFLENDLDYSDELNYLQNDYPLAPGQLKVSKKFCLNINYKS